MTAPLSHPIAQRDHRETRDAYRGELFRHGRYRVAMCKDGIQWLLQHQRAHFPPGRAAWDTLAYCQTRKALSRLYRTHSGQDAPELARLPERIATGGVAK